VSFQPQPGNTRAKPGSTAAARLYGAHFQKETFQSI